MANEPVFSDIDLRFELNPFTNDIGRKTNSEAIKQSMRNIIFTSFYEKPFKSSFGSSVKNMLFEPLTPISATVIKKVVEQAITNFEPRVDLEKVTVQLIEDDNAVDVSIFYTILGTTTLQTFNVILQRTR